MLCWQLIFTIVNAFIIIGELRSESKARSKWLKETGTECPAELIQKVWLSKTGKTISILNT